MRLSHDEEACGLVVAADIHHLPDPGAHNRQHDFPTLRSVAPNSLTTKAVDRPEVPEFFRRRVLDQRLAEPLCPARGTPMLPKYLIQGF